MVACGTPTFGTYWRSPCWKTKMFYIHIFTGGDTSESCQDRHLKGPRLVRRMRSGVRISVRFHTDRV